MGWVWLSCQLATCITNTTYALATEWWFWYQPATSSFNTKHMCVWASLLLDLDLQCVILYEIFCAKDQWIFAVSVWSVHTVDTESDVGRPQVEDRSQRPAQCSWKQLNTHWIGHQVSYNLLYYFCNHHHRHRVLLLYLVTRAASLTNVHSCRSEFLCTQFLQTF